MALRKILGLHSKVVEVGRSEDGDSGNEMKFFNDNYHLGMEWYRGQMPEVKQGQVGWLFSNLKKSSAVKKKCALAKKKWIGIVNHGLILAVSCDEQLNTWFVAFLIQYNLVQNGLFQ